jgi:hypothetical protein
MNALWFVIGALSPIIATFIMSMTTGYDMFIGLLDEPEDFYILVFNMLFLSLAFGLFGNSIEEFLKSRH